MPFKTPEARREHAAKHRDRFRAAQREWRANNLEHCRAVDRNRDRKPYNRAWRIKNLEHVKARKAKWNAENPETVRAMKQAYYAKNRDKILAKMKALYESDPKSWYAKVRDWQALNPEKMKRYQSKWSSTHKEQIAKRMKRYHSEKYAENPQKFIVRSILQSRKHSIKVKARRSARLLHRAVQDRLQNLKRISIQLGQTEGDPEQIVDLVASLRGSEETKCRYCGKSLFGEAIHIDHIIPLSRGGKHSVDNLCASCPTCNLSKGNKTVEEWNHWKQTTGKLVEQQGVTLPIME